MIETCCTLEPPFAYALNHDIASCYREETDIYLLGKKFTKKDGLEKIREYVRSRFWFTYRKNFSPIGGTGPESDQGWGCMLRCAQMVLGEVLLRRHIGKHFIWNEKNEKNSNYDKILEMFHDEKTALYSIHQIAQMGVSEGKAIGEWFGPNTAAQVLKKLAIFDTWSNIAVHVALDNILIKSDVTKVATMSTYDAVKLISADGCVDESHLALSTEALTTSSWRPVLLLVPLRLGLTNMNKCYLPALQEYFKLDSCVGIIGGRPNRALYFVGIFDDKLIYLDPHYCRPSLSSNNPKEVKVESNEEPSTYHCDMTFCMDLDQVDPSLAMAFFCESEESFKKLSEDLKTRVFPSSNPPLFEQLNDRPKYWPPFEPYTGVKAKIEMKEFDDMGDPSYIIDDDFEVLHEDEPHGTAADLDFELEDEQCESPSKELD
ncbi:unnamed protein product [Auanema sp. JU1783]|nr:unnamed protein product [Auanema sp. JU1783]